MKTILKFIGNGLSLMLMVAIFLALVSALSIGAILLITIIGSWIGVGKNIFIYAVFFIAFWMAWDALAWVVGRIADRDELRKEQEYFEQKSEK